jgi:hypothetical protein
MLEQKKQQHESRKADYEKYNVPYFIKHRVSRICDLFCICGISDPMYISNIIARELGVGNGKSEFNYVSDFEIDGVLNKALEHTCKTINVADAEKIAARLLGSYGCNIYNTEICKNALVKILIGGQDFLKLSEYADVAVECIKIKREQQKKFSDDSFRIEFLQGEIDVLKNDLENYYFIDCKFEQINGIDAL